MINYVLDVVMVYFFGSYAAMVPLLIMSRKSTSRTLDPVKGHLDINMAVAMASCVLWVISPLSLIVAVKLKINVEVTG